MDFITQILPSLRGTPQYTPSKLLRIDAFSPLLIYHEIGTGSTPAPTETGFLPFRTRLAVNSFSTMGMVQTHAYYEEIDDMSAVSVGQTSAFSAGHWWVIHPVSGVELLHMSTDALRALERWIEVEAPSTLFVRRMWTVVKLRRRREETLEGVKGALRKRGIREEREAEEREGGEVKVESRHTDAALEESERKGKEAAEEAQIRDGYEFA